VAALDLVDKKDLFPLHADFCSRLGMTFSLGEYAGIEAIQDKAELAEKLFTLALRYAPDHRAYLGLGLLKQQHRALEDAEALFCEGIDHYPDSQDLHISLGVTYMNQGRFRDALTHLLPFRDTPAAAAYVEACCRELGEAPGFSEKRGRPVR
jgi:anaerobic magnesium-protoporphyrin IX monomethyl ester cyclase